jgi:rare lipoprotein A
MFSRSCNKPLCSWKIFRLFVVGLTATALSACAQSPLVTNKTVSLSTSRQASALRKKPRFATTKHTDEASNTTYGVASFYSEGSQTASGEKFDAREMTAAHRTLPFGTHVRITNVTNGQSVTVRINDRGPFVPGRVVDVSPSAAKTIGITGGVSRKSNSKSFNSERPRNAGEYRCSLRSDLNLGGRRDTLSSTRKMR